MRIAFFTPVSPIQSALADFGEGLALALQALPEVTVDLFIDQGYAPDSSAIINALTILPHQTYATRRADYDVTLYSLGDNGRFHGYILDYVHRYPGIVILNDLTLHRCLLWHTVGRGRPQAYLDELAYAYDVDAARVAAHIGSELGNELLLRYPLFERVVDSSLGVIVQNDFARFRILAQRPSTPIRTIPYPFFMPPGFPQFELEAARAEQRITLQIDPDAFVVGSFGIFVPNKHLAACLTAFARVAQTRPSARYILGGAPADGYDLEAEIARLGLAEQVHITGWLPLPDFARQMLALDVGIHLRHPHIGGTPYTPIRLMGLGVATIVSDIEPLAELPPGACAKIVPDDYAEATLSAILQRLAADRDFLELLQANGRRFIQQRHDIADIARQYVRFIQSIS